VATQLFHEPDNLQPSFLAHISITGRLRAAPLAKATLPCPALYKAQTGLSYLMQPPKDQEQIYTIYITSM